MERMKRECLAIVSIVCASTLGLGFMLVSVNAGATTLYVGGIGPNNYTTIQSAIDNAKHGDIIYVSNGVYQENLAIERPLTLIGEDRRMTSIMGEGTGDVIHVSADWVNITEFTVSESGSRIGDAGIELFDSENCAIENVVALSNDVGVILETSDHNTIINISASDNGYGIKLIDSHNNTITNSDFSSHTWYGILLEQSNGNYIADSRTSKSRHGLALNHYSSYNTIENATASNTIDGISLYLSNGNRIANSTSSENEFGISLSGSDGNTIVNNTVSSNTRYGISLGSSYGNIVYHNHIIDNKNQAIDDSDNQWDNGYPSGGNYWSDYGGVDEKSGPDQDQPGGDGIADSPYSIEWGDSVDRYPFYHQEVSAFEPLWYLVLVVIVLVAVSVLFVLFRRKKREA